MQGVTEWKVRMEKMLGKFSALLLLLHKILRYLVSVEERDGGINAI